ncbi:MAG: hypothetical protein GTO02_16875 [Candidatus Dadabacteria bacterium]|nr:hypothetical protein [Candidatus Dadabacteria bacterium]
MLVDKNKFINMVNIVLDAANNTCHGHSEAKIDEATDYLETIVKQAEKDNATARKIRK